MKFKARPLDEQVILLTGATSGIGLATARHLAGKGARLVLVARGEEALNALAAEIGERAIAHPADVADRAALSAAAEAAIARWGRLDTWINDAGVAIYGRTEDVPEDEQRRLFETNYWGALNGMLEALALHRKHGAPNKIVTVGSALSDRTMIYQGTYSASKHAIKAITDALRMEVQAEGLPLSITLIKPGSVDTPYMEHASNHLQSQGTRNPPVAYAPELVAEAIANACTRHVRDIDVGGIGWATSKAGQLAPGLMDQVMQMIGRMAQVSDRPPRPGMRDNLEQAARGGEERSNQPGPSPKRFSLLTSAEMHPLAASGLAVALGLGAMALMQGQQARRRRAEPSGRPMSGASPALDPRVMPAGASAPADRAPRYGGGTSPV